MERWLNRIGIVLLGGALVWSCFYVLQKETKIGDDRIRIRFAHWQLEGGLREAFDAVAARYMEMHPHVKVEQMAVPGRVYPTWLRTAYAGGVMPDLIVIGGSSDEDLVLHYQPITSHVMEPNPYNVGTVHEGVPWRETFINGLAGSSGLETLQDYYSVPVAELSVRMYLNERLWEQYFGDRPPPQSFAEFIEVCAQVDRKSKEAGTYLLPLAGSRFTANVLMIPLFQSQTQKLWQAINPLDDLGNPSTSPSALPFLPGLANLEDPGVRKGFEIMRAVGMYLQEGFLQLDRDDAILMFARERALMLPTGAWDYGSILEQSRFPITIFHLPYPRPGEGYFGENVLGVQSEAGSGGATNFHLSTRSAHPEIAIDFLKFLTSYEGNSIFSSISKWPPSVAGIEMEEETQAFAPIVEGYPGGFAMAPMMWGRGELYRLQSQAFHRLFDPEGGVEAFLEDIRPRFDAAIEEDVRRFLSERERSLKRSDIMLGAALLEQSGGRGVEASQFDSRRISLLQQSQNFQELFRYRTEAHLEGRLLPKRTGKNTEAPR